MCDDMLNEDLREAKELLDSLNAEILAFPRQRPDFGPLQIRDPKELRKGMYCRWIHNEDQKYEKEYFEWLILIRDVDFPRRKFTYSHIEQDGGIGSAIFPASFEDYALYPHQEGTWNNINWLAYLVH